MRFILTKLKPFTKYCVIVFICVLGATVTSLYMPNILSNIINNGIIKGDINYILASGGIMLGIALLGAVSNVGKSFYASKLAGAFSNRLRKEVFDKIEGFSLAEFDSFGTSSLITRTTNDILQLQQLILMTFRMVLTAPFMAVGGIVMAYSKSPKLSLIILIAMPLILLTTLFIQKKAIPLSNLIQKKIDKVNLILREKLTGVRVIRAFTTEKYENKRFDAANQDLTDTSVKMLRTMVAMMPALMVIMNLTTVVLVYTGGLEVSYGNMLVGDILALVQYVMQIMMSMTTMSMVFVMLPRASASIARIQELLQTQETILDSENAVEKLGTEGSVEFKNVSFRYGNAETPALSNISFSAQPGKTTAIIGSTGSGKSTIANLMLRFYDATEGEILINGVDIRKIKTQVLRENIGYVAQKAVLFRGSISDNIQNGNASATEEQIIEASKVAQAYDFIVDKQDKFSSEIAQGGQNVSGGQKQRLSIARAVVRNPEIYIFDDSFSALDFKTDLALRNALKKHTHHATTIIIAQRVSTIKDAENIIVLDSGCVVGSGTHRELLKSCDVYKEIVESQMSLEEVEK